MDEINVVGLKTDSPEFPAVRKAAFQRYQRLRDGHVPHGTLTRGPETSPRERAASQYTLVIVQHADVAARAFREGAYAPGFALARPTLEALLKQFMLYDFDGDAPKKWRSIPDRKLKVDLNHLTRLVKQHPVLADVIWVWKTVSPVFNDFVHGGTGQLVSNPIDKVSEPQYRVEWYLSTILLYTIAVLCTSSWFWRHLGDVERCEAIGQAIASEDWGNLRVHDGRSVRVG